MRTPRGGTSICLGIGARSDRTDNVMIVMKPQPEPSAQEVLAGLVERVTYHNAENGFCVLRAKARGHRDIVTVVGHSATISAGEWITASGEWGQRPHPWPAVQSKISAAWAEQKAVREIMVFLHSHGVGTARAVRIFKTYGSDAIQVMTENPYRLARDIRGIGFKTADAIAMKLGIEKTATIRVRAGISYALTEAMDQGHCGLPTEELIPLAEKLLEVPQQLIRTALGTACLTTVRHGGLSHGRRGLFAGSSGPAVARWRRTDLDALHLRRFTGRAVATQRSAASHANAPTAMTRTADRLMKRSWSSALSLEGFAAYPVGAYPSRTSAMPVGFRLLTATLSRT